MSRRLKILPLPEDELLPIQITVPLRFQPNRGPRHCYVPGRRVLHTRDQLNAAIATLVMTKPESSQSEIKLMPVTLA